MVDYYKEIYDILSNLNINNDIERLLIKTFKVLICYYYLDNSFNLHTKKLSYSFDFKSNQFSLNKLNGFGFVIEMEPKSFNELIDIILEKQKLNIEQILFGLI